MGAGAASADAARRRAQGGAGAARTGPCEKIRSSFSAGRTGARMLAFDIETTGLDREHCLVTVVCTEDFRTGERRAYEFARVAAEGDSGRERARLTAALVAAFDGADSLCAFNGVRFDIPFLHKALRLSELTVAGWLLKTSDILEACRLEVFGPRHTFSLNLLCEFNNVPMKTSSGCEAVRMAAEGRWHELREYCADDVRILCDLYRRRELRNPRGFQTIDVRRISHCAMCTTAETDHLRPSENFASVEINADPSVPTETASALSGVAAECERLHAELNAVRAELVATRAELDATRAELDATRGEAAKHEAQLALYKGVCTCLDSFV